MSPPRIEGPESSPLPQSIQAGRLRSRRQVLDAEWVESVLARLTAAVEKRSSGTVWGWIRVEDPAASALRDLWSLDAVAAEGPRLRWRGPDSERARSTRGAAPEIAAVGAARLLCAHGEDRFATIRRRGRRISKRIVTVALDGTGDELPGWARPRWFGGFSFRAAGGGRGNGSARARCWSDLPEAAFILPEIALQRTSPGLEHGPCVLTIAVPCERGLGQRRLQRVARRLRAWARPETPDAGIVEPVGSGDTGHLASPPNAPAQAPCGQRDYRRRVGRALEAIAAGRLEKVVVARRCGLECELDQRDLMERLDGVGDATVFGFGLGPSLFFGASPERLVAVDGRHLRTEALAGTRPRSEPGLAAAPLGSPKDRDEHGHVVDDLLLRLTPRCSVLECAMPRERIAGPVVHLNTPIHGVLRRPDHVLDLVGELHPTPAVGGSPRTQALDWIDREEGLDRGWYAAPFGWFDAHGAGEFVVALRSGVWRGPAVGDRRSGVELFAGAGIVAGSAPQAEAEETEHKLDALRHLLAGPLARGAAREGGAR